MKLFYGAVQTPGARVCVLGSDAAPQLRYTRLDPFGHRFGIRALPAQISRPDTRSLQATFTLAGARLHSGRYSWQAQTHWTDAGACATAGACDDRAPDNANVIAQITPPPISTPVGCDARGAPLRRFGPRTSANVALTFDDGPSQYTPVIVHILEHKHIPATFFLVGKRVPGHRALLHRMLRDGFMIGNHTLSHANVAGGGAFAARQIVTTQAIIRRAAGFTPCLFRPPYGATSDALTAVVHGLGAMSILWDVDPRDWSNPGTSTIISTVLHQTRRGSIIVLHDGGGPRKQTVAALTTIIDTLLARGLNFVTVDQLLHLHTREQPSPSSLPPVTPAESATAPGATR